MIREQVDHRLEQFLARDYGTEKFAKWAGKELAVEFEARDFRGLDFQDAQRLRPGPGRAEGRGPDHGRPGGEPARPTPKTRANGTGRPWRSLPIRTGTRASATAT